MNKILGKVVGNTTATPIAVSNMANALKGSASGNILVLTDVSPIQHDIIACEDVGSTDIVRRGKNMFDYKAWVEYCNGAGGSGASEDVVYAGEDCFSYVDRPQDTTLRFSISGGYIENTQYTFTLEAAVSSNASGKLTPIFLVHYTDGSNDYIQATIYDNKFTKITLTTDANKTIKGFRVPTNSASTTIYIKKNMQIEIGANSTESEPYVEPVGYYSSSGNTPIKIPSLYPTTVLHGLIGSEIVTAEYNRDINKVIANLENALLSLGGNA